MPKAVSAGLLMYRVREEQTGASRLEVLLAHPGGPYFVRKDIGAWGIPKGAVEPGEDLFVAAQREFTEETGLMPAPPFLPLGGVKYRNHKVVYAWAFEGECDPATITSVAFEMEWPKGSGSMVEFPEVDRAAWFSIPEATERIMSAQRRFVEELEAKVNGGV